VTSTAGTRRGPDGSVHAVLPVRATLPHVDFPLAMTLAWLLVGAALVRSAGRLAGPRGPTWVLGLVCSGVGVWVAERWLAGWHLREWPVMARDFVQVCDAAGRIRDGDWSGGPWPQRTPTSAAIAGLSARALGIVDGLRLSGALGLGACLFGLFAWATTLGGPVSGSAAVALALALAPVVVLPRSLHVYAPSFAAWVLAAAAATGAARRRSVGALALAGLASAACLLLDGRGLPFALAALTAGMLGLPEGGWRSRLVGVGALLLPVLLSGALAHFILPAETPTLETQALWFHADVAGLDPHRSGQSWTHPGFLWGHSPPWMIPWTLATLADLGAATRAAAHTSGAVGLVPPVALAMLGAVGAFRLARPAPRPWLATVIAAAPFLAALLQALATRPLPRLLAGPSLILALAGGLAFAAIAAPREQRLLPAALGGLWLLLAVGGAVPGALHPDAEWRRPITQLPDVGPLLALDPVPWPPEVVRAGLDDPRCRALLADDLAAGHPWGGRMLRWNRPE